MLNEIKITYQQFNYINAVRFEHSKQFQYINNIWGNRYHLTEDITFVTYEDKGTYYLVFEAEQKEYNKIKPSSIVDRLIKEKKEQS